MRIIKNKIIASVISIILIGTLLILSPAADAFSLHLSVSNTSPIKGDPFNIVISANIDANEIINIDSITLNITGPSNTLCTFYPNSTTITGCENVTITLINSSEYGYGYGYGLNEEYTYKQGYKSGILKYNITIDSKNLAFGDYNISSYFKVGNNKIISESQTINISNRLQYPLNSCSLRANSGLISAEDINFSERNKLNLYYSVKKDIPSGEGTLTAQDGSERLSYKFNISNATTNKKGLIIFETSGTLYTDKIRKEQQISSLIIVNKSSGKVVFNSINMNAQNMEINFINKC